MSLIKQIRFLIPILILATLLAIVWRELYYSKPYEIPSPLVGETLPNFNLPTLADPLRSFTPTDFPKRVSLLNVWASWCPACTYEIPMLVKISKQYNVPIYSIVYKDDANAARDWLKKHGDPFIKSGLDLNGDTAIDLGVYGTPETFVISPDGKIIYRHLGAIDERTWDNVIYPLIKRYQT